MSKIKWCEHIDMRRKKTSPDLWIDDCWTIYYDAIPSNWDFCPICSAKRPPKIEDLWERLSTVYLDKYMSKFGVTQGGFVSKDCMEVCALEAKHWMKEQMEEIANTYEHDFMARWVELSEKIKP